MLKEQRSRQKEPSCLQAKLGLGRNSVELRGCADLAIKNCQERRMMGKLHKSTMLNVCLDGSKTI